MLYPMNKITSIGALLVIVAIIIAGVWSLKGSSERAVYLAVLAPHASSTTALVSKPSTCGISNSSRPIEGIPSSLLKSFLSANTPGAGSVSLGSLNGHFAIADSALVGKYAAAGVPFRILDHGRHDLASLSRAGFNANESEALFCVEGLSGVLYLVHLKDGNWQLVKSVVVWMS